MAADFSGLVGKVFLATQVSRVTVGAGSGGTFSVTEVNLMADQVDIVGTWGADATFTITAVGPSGNFIQADLAISSKNFFVNAAVTSGTHSYGTFLGNDATSFVLNGGSIPGLGAAFLYFTNTPQQQPGPGNSATVSSSLGSIAYTPPCFAAGTRIETTRGMIAVEALRIGDQVLLESREGTESGSTREIVWIGHRNVTCTRHPDPGAVWPVRVHAGAFGDGLPIRDLDLSPDHAVFAGGALIPVKDLINGHSIVQIPVTEVTYWHVELDRHDVILAENLPVESFLENGNRQDFSGEAALTLHPGFASPQAAGAPCHPIVRQGPIVEHVRATLTQRQGLRIAAAA